MKHTYILLLLLFSSCLIRFTGITNDYDLLTENQKSKIKKLNDFNSIEKDYIYELTGPQLLNELKKYDKSLVYYFVNGCKSENCLPLQIIVNYAAEFDYKLFLIMCGYGGLKQTEDQNIDAPLFSINTDYYESNKSKIYAANFKTDIGLTEYLGDNIFLGSYFFYEKDKLIDVKERIKYEM